MFLGPSRFSARITTLDNHERSLRPALGLIAEIEEDSCLYDPVENLGHHRFVLDIERQGRASGS